VHDILDALAAAWQLVLSGDPTLVAIVSLSLSISFTAVFLASVLGLPLGAALAVLRFPGRNAAVVVVNALMGLPPVVAGLFVYLLLSRSGPLGSLGLLFTPGWEWPGAVRCTWPKTRGGCAASCAWSELMTVVRFRRSQ
jgi:tungstate transport system permease protein